MGKGITARWGVLLFVLLLKSPGWGATVNAASCALADVQSAVNTAAVGDTVHLPTCTQTTWTSTVTINKQLILEGNGAANTILRRSRVAADFESNEMFVISSVTGFEMRQMTLDGTQDTDANVWQDFAVSCFTCVDFRFHDMVFQYFAIAIHLRGDPTVQRGVIDHNTFHHIYWCSGGTPCSSGGALGYGTFVVGGGTYPALALGTSQNVFIEDNTYTESRHNVAGHNGGRYVFRYNTVVSQQPYAQAIDMHGFDGSWPAGGRQYEIYNNTVSCGGVCNAGGFPSMFCGFGAWGGDGVIFNNDFNDTSAPVRLSANTNGTGTNCGAAYPMAQQPREVYVWNNTPNTVVIDSACTSHIVLNRDYFTTARPGYTAYTYPHPATVAASEAPPTITRILR